MRKLLFVFIMSLMTTIAYARDQISIVGSSTVFPFSTVVAEKVGKKGIKTPVIESTGTGGGMKLFCKGIGVNTPDMTNASRAIKPKEKQMCFENGVTDISQVIIGLDGIAIIRSLKNEPINFTQQQLWEALSEKGSKPEKWSDIDSSLPNIKIQVLVPPPTSGTRDAWNELVMAKGCAKEVKEANKKDCHLLREDGAIIEAGENDTLIVQKLQAEDTKFGIFGFSYYVSNKDKTIAHQIDGVDISLKGIQDGSYPISRPLFFYVKKQHVGVIPGIDEFVKSFTSKKAIGAKRGYLTDLGLIPLANPQEDITPVK